MPYLSGGYVPPGALPGGQGAGPSMSAPQGPAAGSQAAQVQAQPMGGPGQGGAATTENAQAQLPRAQQEAGMAPPADPNVDPAAAQGNQLDPSQLAPGGQQAGFIPNSNGNMLYPRGQGPVTEQVTPQHMMGPITPQSPLKQGSAVKRAKGLLAGGAGLAGTGLLAACPVRKMTQSKKAREKDAGSPYKPVQALERGTRCLEPFGAREGSYGAVRASEGVSAGSFGLKRAGLEGEMAGECQFGKGLLGKAGSGGRAGLGRTHPHPAAANKVTVANSKGAAVVGSHGVPMVSTDGPMRRSTVGEGDTGSLKLAPWAIQGEDAFKSVDLHSGSGKAKGYTSFGKMASVKEAELGDRARDFGIELMQGGKDAANQVMEIPYLPYALPVAGAAAGLGINEILKRTAESKTRSKTHPEHAKGDRWFWGGTGAALGAAPLLAPYISQGLDTMSGKLAHSNNVIAMDDLGDFAQGFVKCGREKGWSDEQIVKCAQWAGNFDEIVAEELEPLVKQAGPLSFVDDALRWGSKTLFKSRKPLGLVGDAAKLTTKAKPVANTAAKGMRAPKPTGVGGAARGMMPPKASPIRPGNAPAVAPPSPAVRPTATLTPGQRLAAQMGQLDDPAKAMMQNAAKARAGGPTMGMRIDQAAKLGPMGRFVRRPVKTMLRNRVGQAVVHPVGRGVLGTGGGLAVDELSEYTTGIDPHLRYVGGALGVGSGLMRVPGISRAMRAAGPTMSNINFFGKHVMRPAYWGQKSPYVTRGGGRVFATPGKGMRFDPSKMNPDYTGGMVPSRMANLAGKTQVAQRYTDAIGLGLTVPLIRESEMMGVIEGVARDKEIIDTSLQENYGIGFNDLVATDESGQVTGVNPEAVKAVVEQTAGGEGVDAMMDQVMADPQKREAAFTAFEKFRENAPPEVRAQIDQRLAQASGMGGLTGLFQGFRNLPGPAQALLIGALVSAIGGMATGNTGMGLLMGAAMAGLGLFGGAIPGMEGLFGNVMGGGEQPGGPSIEEDFMYTNRAPQFQDEQVFNEYGEQGVDPQTGQTVTEPYGVLRDPEGQAYEAPYADNLGWNMGE